MLEYSRLHGAGKAWRSLSGTETEDIGAASCEGEKRCVDGESAEDHGRNENSGAGWIKIDMMSWMTRGDGLCSILESVVERISSMGWSLGVSKAGSP